MRFTLSTVFAVPLLLCLLATTSNAETVLFEGTYKGKYAGLTIETTRRLVQLNDGNYRLESKASNFLGSLGEISHFTKVGDDWRPLEYIYKRRVVGARAQETITFDWDNNRAHYTHSKKPDHNTEHELAPDILDPALYQLRIQRDLALGAKELDYNFIKRDRIRNYTVAREPTDGLTINGTHHTAIKVQRVDSDDDKHTYVWVLPEVYYLLGKIIHVEDDGDSHQMVLTKYKVNGPLLKQFFAEDPAPAQARKASSP